MIQTLDRRNSTHVLFSGGEFYGQRTAGRNRSNHFDEGETPARASLRLAAGAFRRSSVHRGIRVAGARRSALAAGHARHGCGVYALRTGTSPISDPTWRDAV